MPNFKISNKNTTSEYVRGIFGLIQVELRRLSIVFHQSSSYVQNGQRYGRGDEKTYHRAKIVTTYVLCQYVFTTDGNAGKYRYRQSKHQYQTHCGRRALLFIFHYFAPKKSL
jgi:hypothetical protein